MFFRVIPQTGPPPRVPSPPVSSPAVPQPDKALPLIPFSPDWAQATAETKIPIGDPFVPERRAAVTDVTDLPLILAEADPASREVICELGRKWGYAVVPAGDGLDALAAISAQTRPALAVINSQMNGLNGIELCRAARRMNRPVYIILVTERSGSAQLAAARAAGADDYLITPFDADELCARIGVGARVLGLESQLAAMERNFQAASLPVEELTTATAPAHAVV